MSDSSYPCPECGVQLGNDPSSDDPRVCRSCSVENRGLVGPNVYYAGGSHYILNFPMPESPVLRYAVAVGSVAELETEIETEFSIRMRRPSDGEKLWTVVVEGPNNTFDVGMAENPDEALLQVIDTVALYDFDSDDNEGGPVGR